METELQRNDLDQGPSTISGGTGVNACRLSSDRVLLTIMPYGHCENVCPIGM